jgi:5'-nucleotidase
MSLPPLRSPSDPLASLPGPPLAVSLKTNRQLLRSSPTPSWRQLRTVTFGQIFQMQPFGNNLVTKTYNGAQLKAVLEQQFDRGESTPRVATLLIPSQGFRFRYDLKRPTGDRITLMELNGKPIAGTDKIRVTVNNFLSSGGDGFTAFASGTDATDGGLDLDAMEAWLRKGQPVPSLGRTKD